MVRITFENLASVSPTGLYNGPLWLGFHDGSFDLFNSGTVASPAIEALAELGDSSLVGTAFAAAQPLGQSLTLNNPGGPGPGLFTPGSSRSILLDLDAMAQRYLSFGAMVVPSNDTFIANADPMALSLFNPMGAFLGTQSWTLTGANLWDSGTETNVPGDGAAFVAGVNALLGGAEGGVIHSQPLDGLDNTIGLTTPAGTVIGEALSSDPLFRITVSSAVPEPSTYGLIGAAVLGCLVASRRLRSRRRLPVVAPTV